MPSESELDDIIKKIDAQIAALEKEEAEEKAKKETETKVETPFSPEPLDLTPEKPSEELEVKEATHVEEGGPKTSEVVHSNMVDLENFKLKENEEAKPDVKEEKEEYDDFFGSRDYRGEIRRLDRYGNGRTYYFCYDRSDKARVMKSVLLEYVYSKYADKLKEA